jgi:hypothetical protein
VLPRQRFDDFELYFSCSNKPLDFYDPVTQMYGQNTLSIQWTAEAFRAAYLLFHDPQDLIAGRFAADLLSLYQQVWRPPYLDFYGFGGFGVMNTDAEWNDARQAQFAETLANYYELTKELRYLERAVAAERAGFALMVMDENKQICPRNYQGTERQLEIHGASAENYGHRGLNARSYQSGFHWGTGSALTTAALLHWRYSDLYVDAVSGRALGLDGVIVKSVRRRGHTILLSTATLAPDVPHDGYLHSASANWKLKIDGYPVAIARTGRFTWPSP